MCCFVGLGVFFCLFEALCCVVSFLLVLIIKCRFVLRGFCVLKGLWARPVGLACFRWLVWIIC